MSSTPRDLDSLRCLIAFKTSDSKSGAKDKNSEDDKMVGKIIGQGLLYSDCKYFENLSTTSQDWFKCLPSASRCIEATFPE
jgi:hypothetical protein